jgi:hypothetical protein
MKKEDSEPKKDKKNKNKSPERGQRLKDGK